MARQSLREIVQQHIERHTERIREIRAAYPEQLWDYQERAEIKQRVGHLLDDLVSHFQAYASEQRKQTALFEAGGDA